MNRRLISAVALMALGLNACGRASENKSSTSPAGRAESLEAAAVDPPMSEEQREREARERLKQVEGEQPVTENGVTLRRSDVTSQAFMALSINCGPVEASMRDFLKARIAQARAAGITQSYEASSTVFGGDNVVFLSEYIHGRHGQELPGFPGKTDYVYILDWTGARLVRTEPFSHSLDPVAFMQINPEPVCNFALARARRAQLARQPVPPVALSAAQDEATPPPPPPPPASPPASTSEPETVSEPV